MRCCPDKELGAQVMTQLASKEADLIMKTERIQHLEKLVNSRDGVIADKDRQISTLKQQLEAARQNQAGGAGGGGGTSDEVRRLSQLVRDLGDANAKQGEWIRRQADSRTM